MALKTSKLLLLSLIAGLALSACGGGSGGATNYDSVSALAKDLGCSGAKLDGQKLMVKEEGTCQLDGAGELTVDIWPDGADIEKAAKAFSGFGGNWVVGTNWTVIADTNAGAKKVEGLIGGKDL